MVSGAAHTRSRITRGVGRQLGEAVSAGGRGGLRRVVLCLVGHVDHLGRVPAAALLVVVVSDLDPSRLSGLFQLDRQVQHAVAVPPRTFSASTPSPRMRWRVKATLRSFGRQDLVAFAEHGSRRSGNCVRLSARWSRGRRRAGPAPRGSRRRSARRLSASAPGACAGHQLAGQPVEAPERIACETLMIMDVKPSEVVTGVLFAVRHARRARRWSLACQAQDVRVLQVAPSADPELARILLGIQHAAYAIEATLLDR